MPVIDLSLSSNTIKTPLTNYLWVKFNENLFLIPLVYFIYFALVIGAPSNLSSLIISHYQISEFIKQDPHPLPKPCITSFVCIII